MRRSNSLVGHEVVVDAVAFAGSGIARGGVDRETELLVGKRPQRSEDGVFARLLTVP